MWSTSRSDRGKKSRKPTRRGFRPHLELLETRLAPTVSILNGGGLGYAGNGGGGPPDVTGAAGPNSYLEVTNSTVTLFSPKATRTILDKQGIFDFFYAIGNQTRIDQPFSGQLIAIAASPTGATEAGTTVTITTGVPHGFSVGQAVQVSGVGVPGYNGVFTITAVTATTFTYTDATSGLANSGGGTASVDPGSCGVCDSTGLFDNLMGANGRFIIGDIDVDQTTNVSQLLLAVSVSSNPTAFDAKNWNFYHITTTEGSGSSTSWGDYPGNPGFNADAFVDTFNMIGKGGCQVVSINASDLANGVSQATLTASGVFHNDVPGGAQQYRPTTMHDSVAGDPMWLIHNHGDGAKVDVVKMTNVLSTSATFDGTESDPGTALTLPMADQFVATVNFNPLNPDSTPMGDPGNLILKAGEFNNTIVATQAVEVGTASVVSATVQVKNGVSQGGFGYRVGDMLTINGGTLTTGATAATLTVATVDTNGGVLTVTVANPGNYSSLAGIDGTVGSSSGNGAQFNLNWRGELDVLWYAIDVSSGTPAFQLVGGSPNVGRIGFGPNTYCVEPAIDINAGGQIGLGFMESDTVGGAADAATGGFISTFVAAWQPGDAAGIMETPILVPDGTGTANIGGRIGDFSGMNVDPVNGTFWHTNEFGGGGPTDIANFTPGPEAFTQNGVLVVTGTNADDNITLQPFVFFSLTFTQVVDNGVVLGDFLNGTFSSIRVETFGGNDSLTLTDTGGNIGLDFFNVPVTYDGGLGTNSLFLDDHTSSNNNIYTLTAGGVDRSFPFQPLTYSNVQNLTLSLSSGGARVFVLANAPGVTTNLVGNGGNTTVNVSSATGSVQDINGTLNIENPQSPSSITVDNSADTTSHTVTLSTLGANPADSEANTDSWGQIAGLAPGNINYEYGDTSNVTINTGDGADTVNVESTAVPVTINLGSGTDTVNLSPTAKDLANLQADLTINGGTSTDTLVADDSQGQTIIGRIYHLQNDTLQLPALSALVSYTGIANVVLDTVAAAPFTNVIDIQGQVAGSTVTVNGSDANDVLNVDFSAGAAVPPGGLTFDGGGGTNSLNLQGEATRYLTDTPTGPAAGTLDFSPDGFFTAATITYANVQTITDIALPPSGPFALANYLIFNAPNATTAMTVSDGITFLGVQTTQISSGLPGVNPPPPPTFATLAFANRNYATVNSANLADTIVVNTRQAAAALHGLTINAGPGNSLGNYQSTQNTYVLGTAAGVTTTIDATNGWHDISVGLPTDPRINTTGLPGTPLDNIQGALTISGQGSRDVVNLWDWDSSTAQKTYAINSTNIAVTAVNGVAVANPVPISWQGNLSVIALWGSAAADTYQFQTLPTGLAAIVVNGYYRPNTFQSQLTERRTWAIGPNTTVGSFIPGECAIDLAEVYNFIGGPSGDDFAFSTNQSGPGSLAGMLSGNGGTLDYSQDPSAVTLNLATDSATNIFGNGLNGFTGIQSVIGNGSNTTLVGPDGTDYWNITGSNQGNLLVQQAHQPGPFTFSQLPNLTGGAGNDVFQFGPGGSVSGVIEGGGGANMLDYSLYTTGVTVDLSGQDQFHSGAPETFDGRGSASGTAGVQHIQNVIGSPQNDTLIGDDEANVLIGHGGNDLLVGHGGNDVFRFDTVQGPGTRVFGGTITGTEEGSDLLWAFDTTNNWQLTGGDSGTVNGIHFFNCENLLGGLGNDTFHFHPGARFTGYINGNLGNNTLDYSAYAANVSVNLGAQPSQLATGTGYIVGFQTIRGSLPTGTFTPNNTFQGANQYAAWQITGGNSGTVRYGSQTYTFGSFQNLVGGTGVDVFRFSGAGSVSGSLNGGGAPTGQGDWLDYSGFASAVAVNLVTGSATSVNGGLAGAIANIQDVHGGNAGNTMIGNSQGNILIGGLGGGAIMGGSGRSLLIADRGSASITGGSGGDILIGDSTTFDTMNTANELALMSILAEWQSADSYTDRFNDINRGTAYGPGSHLNGNNVLRWGTTVRDNGSPDASVRVTAAPSLLPLDWFFMDTNDIPINFESGEHVNNT